MKHQQKTAVKVCLSLEERHKFAQFFQLLMAVERRQNAQEAKPKKTQPSPKASDFAQASTDTMAGKMKKTKAADTGSLYRGPYFFINKIMYASKRIQLLLRQAYCNDRHHSFNINARSV